MHGRSEATEHSGVWGENRGAGYGVSAISARGEGMFSKGATNGVHGVSEGAEHSGVWGENLGRGYGVSGVSSQGEGVIGISNFQGNIDTYMNNSTFRAVGVQGSGPVGVRGTGTVGVLGVGRFAGVEAHGNPGVRITANTGNLLIGESPRQLPPGVGQTPLPYDTGFRVDVRGRGFFNGGTETGGADVAEFISASDALQPGDVVEIDAEQCGAFPSGVASI